MLDFLQTKQNTWTPPEISEQMIDQYCDEYLKEETEDFDQLIIFKFEPYIDSLLIHRENTDRKAPILFTKRFVFHLDYIWEYEDEQLFVDMVLNNGRLNYTGVIDQIYKYYSETYQEWKLNRYYTKPMRLLDHIYHCMRKGSAKEMLYKAGLDELAAHIDDLDEIDLLSSKPSDIYNGISMKVLRSLNCRDGSLLLGDIRSRTFIKELQKRFPDTFKQKLNDAQCRYLQYLIDGDLTVGEAGRLYNARKTALRFMWIPSQYELFMLKERQKKEALQEVRVISDMDPIYKNHLSQFKLDGSVEDGKIFKEIATLKYYLLDRKEEFNKKIRRANRKRNQDWQERNQGYVVRYPQTINDFFREAIYMSNCLMTYIDAFLENETTILFMRKPDDFNTPYITIEIFDNELMQAYGRFNSDCSPDEAEWIKNYCDRHGIGRSKFKFNRDVDLLF